MAIQTLAYRLVMDHQQFVQGSVASRKELNLAKKLMIESQPPAEKLETAIASLGGLYRKGAIDAATFPRSVQSLKKRFEETKTAGQLNIPVFSNMLQSFKALTPAMFAAQLAIDATRIAFRTMQQEPDTTPTGGPTPMPTCVPTRISKLTTSCNKNWSASYRMRRVTSQPGPHFGRARMSTLPLEGRRT